MFEKRPRRVRGAIAVAAALGAALVAPATAGAEYLGYADLGAGDWYVVDGVIDWSEDNDVIHGWDERTWGPNDPVDRAQAAQILWNHAGAPKGAPAADFEDAAGFGWAAEAISWAVDEGVMDGYGSTFGAWVGLTREQAAKVLCEAVGGEQGDPAALSGFADAGEVSTWARGYVAWAVEEGVMGRGGGLAPQQGCTRAEFVAMLMRVSEADDPNPGGGDDEPDVPDVDPGGGDEVVDPGGDVDPNPGEGEDPGDGVEDPYDIGNGTFTFTDANGCADGELDERNGARWDGHRWINYQDDFAFLSDADGNRLMCESTLGAEPPIEFRVTSVVNWDDDTITYTAHGLGQYHGETSITVPFTRFSSLYTAAAYCPYCNLSCDEYELGYDGPELFAFRCTDTKGEVRENCEFCLHKKASELTGYGSDITLVSDEELLSIPLICRNQRCSHYGEDVSDVAWIGPFDHIGPTYSTDTGTEIAYH